ncbi:MAG: SDR family oxidoreductase [Deltaproteobacteria bacterium]|nr:SDR family oxidoreductase [Deltaproteobacteria bacterium]MBW2418943.1 SDR family oxidoreductase [Deltaproteobacteria bacterium]
MFDLTGRVALVTGAGRGVGEGVARTLAAQGAAVVINDIAEETAEQTAAGIHSAGARAFAAPFDVTDFDACAAGVAAGEEALGPIDILVNNAGGTPGGMWPTPFLETSRDLWPAFVDMNLYGVMNCTRAVAEGMAERGFGRVVSISSDAARVGNKGSSVYGAAKAGVEGFMRSIAKELGPSGVTANSIVLGLIDTVPEEFLRHVNAKDLYPMGRVGTADDVAAGVVYLVSEEAGWVTGQSLVINGGGAGG